MAYTLLVPHPRLGRFSRGQRGIYQHNLNYAQQVEQRQSEVQVEIIEPARTESEVWPNTLAAYRRASQRAGVGGTLGLLVGHGIVGAHIAADLAPPRILRVDEDEVLGLAQRRGENALTPNQQRVRQIGEIVGPYVHRVDLYTCSIGTPAGVRFLNALAETWRVEVRALRGRLVSRHEDHTTEMSLIDAPHGVPRGPWRDRLPPERSWRASEMLERQVELPGRLRDFLQKSHGMAPRRAGPPTRLGAAPRRLGR